MEAVLGRAPFARSSDQVPLVGMIVGSLVLIVLRLLTRGVADRMLGLLITLLWVGGFAPTMVLAWILPDDDPEDPA